MAPKVIKDCGADFCKKNHYIKFVESCLDGPVHGFMDTKDFIKLVDCASEEVNFIVVSFATETICVLDTED